jgi:hypothetical protein
MPNSFLVLHKNKLRAAISLDIISGVFEVKNGKKTETFISTTVEACDGVVDESFDSVMEAISVAEDAIHLEEDILDIELEPANDTEE